MGSKQCDGRNSGKIERADRISDLPDEIVSHVFSFLPTKDAVATSILSRRYKFLWSQVPVIDVDAYFWGGTLEKRIQFQNFVNNVLLLNKVPCLRFCCLTVPSGVDSLYGNAWIEAIAIRKVKEMHLHVHCSVKLPFCVFEKLVVLKLREIPDLDMTSLRLPNLRVLYLIQVIDHDEGLLLLISSCSALQELVIDEYVADPEGNLHVNSSTLKRLEIDEMVDCGEVFIDAPSLEYLMISGYYPVMYYTSDLSSLREADMCLPILCYSEPDSEYRTNNLNFINSLTSLSTLRLRRTKFQGIWGRIYHQLPAFSNVTCLELEIFDSCRCIVPALLDCTPNLVDLTVTCTPSEEDFDFVRESKCSHETHAPSCLLHSIKLIKIRDFDDSEESAEIVRYLLMNARVLNEMKIEYCFKLSPVDEMEIIRELLSFTRGSPTATVQLSSSF